jgi:ribosomal protein S14
MGVEVFTVRQLQAAMGLSYQKTRRLLNGYVSRGTPYSGLLEKCPAISLYDATVTEDGGCGVTVRRREQYFTFDNEVYRAWSGGTSVWLDDDPTNDSNDSSFQQNDSNCCHREEGQNEEDPGNNDRDPDTDRSMYVHVQQNERTESMGGEASGDDRDACVSHIAVIQNQKSPNMCQNSEFYPISSPLNDSNCCHSAVTCCHPPSAVNPADYLPLPVAKDEPCHICGRRPTSSMKRGGGLYLCYDCLKKAKRPAKAQPLPGVLDHRTFARTKVELGRCDVCGEKRAVYRSREERAKVCEGCYARLVREWNGREGVR